MQEFIHAQMTCHARAMELYTAAFQHTQGMREDEIVEVGQLSPSSYSIAETLSTVQYYYSGSSVIRTAKFYFAVQIDNTYTDYTGSVYLRVHITECPTSILVFV
jgi:hypothetical protein